MDNVVTGPFSTVVCQSQMFSIWMRIVPSETSPFLLFLTLSNSLVRVPLPPFYPYPLPLHISSSRSHNHNTRTQTRNVRACVCVCVCVCVYKSDFAYMVCVPVLLCSSDEMRRLLHFTYLSTHDCSIVWINGVLSETSLSGLNMQDSETRGLLSSGTGPWVTRVSDPDR